MTMLKLSNKNYTCSRCNKPFMVDTNHYGQIYRTPCCGMGVIANCTDTVPEGGFVPAPWPKVSLTAMIRVLKCNKDKVA